jgi:flagellar hook assembly protein FlgD
MDISSRFCTNGSGGAISSQNAVSLIGKNIRVCRGSLNYQAKDGESLPISAAGGRSQMAIEVAGKRGKTVINCVAKDDDYGICDFSWEGRTDEDGKAQAGEYLLKIPGKVSTRHSIRFQKEK